MESSADEPPANLKDKARDLLARMPGLYKTASAAYRSLNVVQGIAYVAQHAAPIMKGARAIVVAYSSTPRPRWGHGVPAHPGLESVIAAGRPEYERLLRAFGPLRGALDAIPDAAGIDDPEPSWMNGFFTGIDAAGLYCMLGTQRPRRYMEIGSGYSTKIARRAIRDQGLPTTLLSIDPSPQATVDALCDTVMRQPLEDVDLALFDQLEAGDVLFFDGSHHAFMNSDVTVLWLDVLPRLKPGVLIHIHDIFLPYDYPPEWVDRFYTEQYLLAVALQAPQPAYDVVLPAQYIVKDPALAKLLDEQLGPRAAGGGGSFWLRKR
jgi:hypothetical protein